MRGRREEAFRTLKLVDPAADAAHSVREIESDLSAACGGGLREMLRFRGLGPPCSC